MQNMTIVEASIVELSGRIPHCPWCGPKTKVEIYQHLQKSTTFLFACGKCGCSGPKLASVEDAINSTKMVRSSTASGWCVLWGLILISISLTLSIGLILTTVSIMATIIK